MAKKISAERVLAVASEICGKPPRAMTVEQFEQICGKFKAQTLTIDKHLQRLGYTRPRTTDKIRKLIVREFQAVRGIEDPAAVAARKQKLLADVNKIKVEIGRPEVAWPAILALAASIKKPKLSGWPWVPGNTVRVSSQAHGDSDKPTLLTKLIEFLSRARTDREIETKFGKEGMAELAKMKAEPPKGYRFKEGFNTYQEPTLYLEHIVGAHPVKLQKPVFEVLHATNDPDYLSVIFPPDLEFTKTVEDNKIRILPIDSVFFSDYLCDLERFTKCIQYIAAKPYVWAFLNGDIIGGHDYTKRTAARIREELVRLLAPVAHKILWAQSGPLEKRMMRIDGIEPLADVCAELGIHHTERPVRADIYWKNPQKPIEFYAFHGRSQARKDGSKANAILDALVNNDFPHFTVMGHLQEGMTNNMTVRRLDPLGLTVKEYTAYAIVCPGFKKYQGSEQEKKGYPPPAMGTVACIIGADNHHEASS